jgi:adenylosuccinate lyase
MPHKRNPQVCENVIALCRSIRSIAPLAVEAMICENERDWSCELVEWECVPRACHLTGASLEKTIDILTNLIVYPKNMEENLYKLRGLMLSEAVMMHLGEKMGRLTAHEVVYETCMKAYAANSTMQEALMQNELVTNHFSAGEISELLKPHKYTGLASVFVDRVLAKRPKK